MIELFQEYWQPLLYSDGVKLTGLAMTLWLLVLSLLIGAALAIPLAVGRTSERPIIRRAVRSFTYIFCGTPLYIQLLICYSGFYSLEVVRSNDVLSMFFKNGLNCAILAFSLNTAAYTTEYWRVPLETCRMAKLRLRVLTAYLLGKSNVA